MALTANKTSEYLKTLIDAGSDAMSNLYYVEFLGPNTEDLNDSASLTIRNSNFKMPTFAQETHSVNYLTTSLDLPSPSYSGEKELEFTFRLDSAYKVYNVLKKWESATAMPTLGYAINSIPGMATNNLDDAYKIKVYKMNEQYLSDKSLFEPGEKGVPIKGDLLYTFNYCWIKSITGLSYSYDSSEPINISAKIAFLEVIY